MYNFLLKLLVTALIAPCLNAQVWENDDVTPISMETIAKCEKRGFCEEVPDYPQKLITRLVEEGGKEKITSQFFDYKFDDEETNKTRRVNSNDHCQVQYCEYDVKTIVPKAMQTSWGKWVYVVQLKDKVQSFTVQECRKPYCPCNQILSAVEENMKTWCAQEYSMRDATVFINNHNDPRIAIEKLAFMSCCRCGLRSR